MKIVARGRYNLGAKMYNTKSLAQALKHQGTSSTHQVFEQKEKKKNNNNNYNYSA